MKVSRFERRLKKKEEEEREREKTRERERERERERRRSGESGAREREEREEKRRERSVMVESLASTGVFHFPCGNQTGVKVNSEVIINVLDAYVRRNEGQERVIGTLLGSVSENGKVDVRNAYAVPHNESSEQVRRIYFPRNQIKQNYLLHLLPTLLRSLSHTLTQPLRTLFHTTLLFLPQLGCYLTDTWLN